MASGRRRRARQQFDAARSLGRRAARELREDGDEAGFTITKFGRHADGYYHARVTPAGGRAVYVHCKFGSWMAPGERNGTAVLKEVLPKVAVELCLRMRAAERAERRTTVQENQECDKIDDSHSQSQDSTTDQE